MRLTVFQSAQGDCLLLRSADGHNVLIDGGMPHSYTEHVAPFLNRMHRRGEALDLVYVSHIDFDHIGGVVRLLDDLVDWRVYEFHQSGGHPNPPRPDSLRPPEVASVWHNAFHEQVGDNEGRIEELLAADARILSGHPEERVRELAKELDHLAQGEKHAIQMSRRIGPDQLNIPLNPEYDGGLMFHAEGGPIELGSLRIHVIGPYLAELRELRRQWNAWLESREGERELEAIRRRAAIDEERLASDELAAALVPLEIQAETLASTPAIRAIIAQRAAPATELGERSALTIDNLASLMLYVEEDGRSILLTGDGHCDDVLTGLEDAGLLDEEGGLHVNVLKVPHHGSEHNTTREFARRITADHYVFCGDGSHFNPERIVVDVYLESRLGPAAQRSPNPEAGRRFKVWFNCDPDEAGSKTEYMQAMRTHIRRVQRRSDGQLRYSFLESRSHLTVFNSG